MRLYVILLILPMPLRESKAESTFGKVAGIFHADLYPFVLEWCNAIHPDPLPFIYHLNHLLYSAYNSSKRFQRFNYQLVCLCCCRFSSRLRRPSMPVRLTVPSSCTARAEFAAYTEEPWRHSSEVISSISFMTMLIIIIFIIIITIIIVIIFLTQRYSRIWKHFL